ncbi:hypothetical protein KC726_01070 [Candidatus Woesebacteria bacterium]|nr:hypothetical protein [Candidatus Woesebacteria bacterium]
MSEMVMYGDTILSKPLNLELSDLLKVHPSLLSRGGFPICSSAAVNLVFSLLAGYRSDIVTKSFLDRNQEIPDVLSKPYEILNGVDLYVEANLPQVSSNQRILLKHACGSKGNGIVMDGPYAGLFVAFFEDSRKSAKVVRLFNDSPVVLKEGKIAYIFNCDYGVVDINTVNLVYNQLKYEYTQLFFELVRKQNTGIKEDKINMMLTYGCQTPHQLFLSVGSKSIITLSMMLEYLFKNLHLEVNINEWSFTKARMMGST